MPELNPRKQPSSMIHKIAALPNLTNEQLHKLWRDLYQQEAPKIGRPLIIRRLAWRLQEITFGGLNDDTKQRLNKDINAYSARGKTTPRRIIKPKAGVRFERQWKGETYIVIVRDEGFEMNGKLYRSLTAIVRELTGCRNISGPRFFGLKEAGYEHNK